MNREVNFSGDLLLFAIDFVLPGLERALLQAFEQTVPLPSLDHHLLLFPDLLGASSGALLQPDALMTQMAAPGIERDKLLGIGALEANQRLTHGRALVVHIFNRRWIRADSPKSTPRRSSSSSA